MPSLNVHDCVSKGSWLRLVPDANGHETINAVWRDHQTEPSGDTQMSSPVPLFVSGITIVRAPSQ